MKLEGKVAIVAGAGHGIGQGITHCLAEEGADVAVVDISGDNARKVADEVKALGRKSLAIAADLTDIKKVEQLVQKTIDTFGKIDILVNNIGGLGKAFLARTRREFVGIEEAEWDEVFMLNLKTHVFLCRAVVPHFQKQKSGKIVNISSIAAKGPQAWNPPYGVAKAADMNLTLSLAEELAKDNINVNCINPGTVWTPFWESVNEAEWAKNRPVPTGTEGMTPKERYLKNAESRVPLKRPQTPEDIGRAVVFLVSEDAKNITGQVLHVDGGMRMF